MKAQLKPPTSWLRHLRVFALGASAVGLLGIVGSAAPPIVSLNVAPGNGRIAVSWPAGLSLVQPQVATNLAANAWRDLGPATEATNLTDTIGVGMAFYRLRFLPPTIQTPPLGRSVAAGDNVALTVTATGTAPLTYQWRKDGGPLAGQTGAALALSNLSPSDSGAYSVAVANSLGAVTSVVAIVTVTNVLPAARPQGIYMGRFTGETNGGFAALVGTNGAASILAHNVTVGEGVLATNLPLAADGSFSVAGERQGKLAGKFGKDKADGTMTGTNSLSAAFSAELKASTGVQQANAGFYVGTFGGLLTGSLFFVLAADGTAFAFLTSPTLGSGGTFGVIDATNAFSATAAYTLPGTTLPTLIQITGTLNPATHSFAGSYGLSGISLGTFSLVRSRTP